MGKKGKGSKKYCNYGFLLELFTKSLGGYGYRPVLNQKLEMFLVLSYLCRVSL